MDKRLLKYRPKGTHGQKEDWWYLVTDPSSGQKFVQHEWDHVDLGTLKATRGSRQIPVDEFLSTENDQELLGALDAELKEDRVSKT